MTGDPRLDTAQAFFRDGRWPQAESACRAVLSDRPGDAGALNLLAITLSRSGKAEQALTAARQAVALHGDNADAHGTLGNLLRAAGRIEQAIDAYRKAVELAPQKAVGFYNLGVTLFKAGRRDAAADALVATCRLDPSLAPAHACLGVIYRDQGDALAAAAEWETALRLRPDDGETWHLLGTLLSKLERYPQAVDALQHAVRLRPAVGASHMNLGLALAMSGRLEEALAAFARATAVDPAVAESVQVLLGNIWFDRGRLDDAVACYHRAEAMNPRNGMVQLNLGNMMRDLGRAEEAVACYRRALLLQPDFAAVHSNLLLAGQYCTGVTLAGLAESHAAFDRQQAAPVRTSASSTERRSARKKSRLRLGFVSPDLGRHPVGFFLASLLENLRGADVETVCYSDRYRQDSITRRLRSAATRWREIKPMTDARVAELVRRDEVDILFDLAGHTANNRLLVFARRPAPVQITWAGYVGTTGLAEMDYLLADRFHVPAEAEPFYRERVLRMPHGYICYEPPADAPPVGPLPALGRGSVLFGCFNHLAKITPQGVTTWASVLRRVPGSGLLLKYNRWTNASAVGRMTELFAAEQIDPARLQFEGSGHHADWLGTYNRVDLALDPFPYSGGLTTCEALWMGVPVITCPGETFASRHSLSHCSNATVPEGVAGSLDEYVERAVSLASDVRKLAALRATLRPRMAGSPLCDRTQFARDFLQLLRSL